MPEAGVKTSKFLSLILRHAPETIGLRLDENGWIAVDALLDTKHLFFLSANGVWLTASVPVDFIKR